MVPFPKTDKRVPFHLDCNSTSVSIFCLCRLPKDRQEYVECFSCHGLYHPHCVSIPEWVIKSRLQWNCQKCRNTMAKMGSKNILAGAIIRTNKWHFIQFLYFLLSNLFGVKVCSSLHADISYFLCFMILNVKTSACRLDLLECLLDPLFCHHNQNNKWHTFPARLLSPSKHLRVLLSPSKVLSETKFIFNG